MSMKCPANFFAESLGWCFSNVMKKSKIRRMCEYFNYKVVSLERTRIMNIKLDLPLGEHRELTNDEISSLNKLIDNE